MFRVTKVELAAGLGLVNWGTQSAGRATPCSACPPGLSIIQRIIQQQQPYYHLYHLTTTLVGDSPTSGLIE